MATNIMLAYFGIADTSVENMHTSILFFKLMVDFNLF